LEIGGSQVHLISLTAVPQPVNHQGGKDEDAHDEVEQHLGAESFGLCGFGRIHFSAPMKIQHWVVKQEPEGYSWDDFVRDGSTTWEGVRNYQARNNLKAMQPGDRVLFYASSDTKSVVGIAEVAKAAFPDVTANEPGWVAVELKPVRALAKAVTLAEIKAQPALAGIALARHGRLSVSPLTRDEFERIVKLGAEFEKRKSESGSRK